MSHFIATDLEGTLTAAEGWKSIRAYFDAHGKKAVFRRFFDGQIFRILLHRFKLLSTAALRQQWMIDMAVPLKGFSAMELDTMGTWIAENVLWPQRRATVWNELQRHHDDGGTILIVSALYEPVLRAVARSLRPERVEAIGTPLELRAKIATGKCSGEVCAGPEKAKRIAARVGDHPLVAAYGDTGPDSYMLEISQKPVAVCPDEDLQKIATERKWRIINDDGR